MIPALTPEMQAFRLLKYIFQTSNLNLLFTEEFQTIL